MCNLSGKDPFVVRALNSAWHRNDFVQDCRRSAGLIDGSSLRLLHCSHYSACLKAVPVALDFGRYSAIYVFSGGTDLPVLAQNIKFATITAARAVAASMNTFHLSGESTSKVAGRP